MNSCLSFETIIEMIERVEKSLHEIININIICVKNWNGKADNRITLL